MTNTFVIEIIVYESVRRSTPLFKQSQSVVSFKINRLWVSMKCVPILRTGIF